MIRCRYCMTAEKGLNTEKDVCKDCLPYCDEDGGMTMENWQKAQKGMGERFMKGLGKKKKE